VTEADLKKQVIKNKIKAVGKLAVVFNTLRSEKESIMELKSVLGVQKLPPGSLALGAEGIKHGNALLIKQSKLLMKPNLPIEITRDYLP
jgi:hypothetical protein